MPSTPLDPKSGSSSASSPDEWTARLTLAFDPSSKPQLPKDEPSTESSLGAKLRMKPLRSTSIPVRRSPPSKPPTLSAPQPKVLRGLVFDIENKPGTYGPGDYTHPKVTALGWAYLDNPEISSHCFRRNDPQYMMDGAWYFRKFWDEADFVVGHNIRRHDRKILDGLYTALGLPLLAPKKMVDTYLDMPKMAGLSRSLENLADRWNCPIRKMHLSEYDWERAYDGIPESVEKMRQRVETDVQINAWLYKELIARDLLRW